MIINIKSMQGKVIHKDEVMHYVKMIEHENADKKIKRINLTFDGDEVEIEAIFEGGRPVWLTSLKRKIKRIISYLSGSKSNDLNI